jgi:hypothetical protein
VGGLDKTEYIMRAAINDLIPQAFEFFSIPLTQNSFDVSIKIKAAYEYRTETYQTFDPVYKISWCADDWITINYSLQRYGQGVIVISEGFDSPDPWPSPIPPCALLDISNIDLPYTPYRIDPKDLAIVEILGGGGNNPCPETCYWTIHGNSNIDDAEHFIGPTNGEDFIIKTGDAGAASSTLAERMRITADGRVHIGTSEQLDTYLDGSNNVIPYLQVDGYIQAQKANFTTSVVAGVVNTTEVNVVEAPAWPDYVFEPTHKRMTLVELDNYVQVNKKLPGIPSKATVEANGFKLAEMQIKMLEKIEELTLYIIELEKKIKELEERMNKMEESK